MQCDTWQGLLCGGCGVCLLPGCRLVAVLCGEVEVHWKVALERVRVP